VFALVRRTFRSLLALSLLVATFASPARAWDDFGHMTVAYLAYQKLTPAARARANALIRLNPYYEKWATAVPGDMDKDTVIFMLASLWADEIKGDSNFVSDGSSGGNRPDGSPDPARNTGYDDKLMHKYRHFVDTPFSTDGTSTAKFQIPTPNAQDSIASFRAVLASSDPDAKKSYDLVWLLHLVGDIHQPLHAVTRLSTGLPQGDDGGNKVKLHCTGCPADLHKFWDDALGVTTKLAAPPEEKGLPDEISIRAIVAFARKTRRPKRALAAQSSEAAWVQESFAAAQNQVYPGLVANPDGSSSLTAAYQKAALALARKRVALAGARLAVLLNTELR
jgi:S1/P1 nuclease